MQDLSDTDPWNPSSFLIENMFQPKDADVEKVSLVFSLQLFKGFQASQRKNLNLEETSFLHFHLNFCDFAKNIDIPALFCPSLSNFFHKSAGGLKVEDSNFHPQGLRKTMEM